MEVVRFPSRGGFSVRSIFVFVLTVIITAILWATFSVGTTHADDSQAQWNGASLQYQGKQYTSAGEAKSGDSIGLPSGTPYYVSLENTQGTVASSIATQKAYVIYFAPGASPPTQNRASYAEYLYESNTKRYSNPAGQTTISVDTSTAGSTGTSCAIEGIGWIACPAMTWLANGMDMVFNLIAQFMEVQPLQVNNTSGTLYQTWNVVRSIANVAFIIAFIIIIYSQITNIQVNNYGLKRLIPRLIIAAVAVNLSYFIAAIAVDASNILGYSLQDLFMALQHNVVATGSVDPGAQGNINSAASWGAFTAFVISGGTAAVAGIGGTLVASGGTLTAIAFILLPTLVGLILALMVVFLILAARQAIIIILVIIAPLAMVAYLLPNTEKWFEKWRGLFMTMLIFFPAFAVVFGGAQLAGSIIIKNADSPTMQLLGMAVQIAPLVITPILLKFSGSLLGNIARIVNDPKKGVLDRTRNWSKSHADWHRKRGTGGLDFKGNPRKVFDRNGKEIPGGLRRRNFARRAARNLDQRSRLLADRTSNAESATQTAYENSRVYTKTKTDRKTGATKTVYDTAVQKAAFESDKTTTHNAHAAHVEHAKVTKGSLMFDRANREEVSKETLTSAQNDTAAYFNRQRVVGGSALNASSRRTEISKKLLDTSENEKQSYFIEESLRSGTRLNSLMDSYEASKVTLEGNQSDYAARVDEMKVTTSTSLNGAVNSAQTAKQQAEKAQIKLQEYFDKQNANNSTPMGKSYVDLQEAKIQAEGASSKLADYTAGLKVKGGPLHTEYMQTEEYKQAQSRKEAQLTRIVDEYKAGGKRVIDAQGIERVYIDGQQITGAELARANAMREESAFLAAETQGATSAKYVQQSYVSEVMNEQQTQDPALTNTLLTTAAGIDENGRTRAQANASTQLSKLQSESLSNNVTLLSDIAETNGRTVKSVAKEMFAQQIGQDADGNPVPQIDQDPSLLEAALEALAQDGDIPTMRKARMSNRVDQGMMTRLLARNAGTMKAKGGFDLQNDPTLAGASQERMNASIAANLGSTSAANYPDIKNSEIISTWKNIGQIMADADSATDPKVRASAQEGLQKAYTQVSKALIDGRIRERLGDNLIPAIEIHKALVGRFGDKPGYIVDHDSIDPRTI